MTQCGGWVSVFYKNLQMSLMHWLGRSSCLLGLISGRTWARPSVHSTLALNFRKEGAVALSEIESLPRVASLGIPQGEIIEDYISYP